MTPVRQTPGRGKDGNCLQAAVASVLDLPLEEVPDFGSDEKWLSNMATWAVGRGLGVVVTPELKGCTPFMDNVWVVAVGPVEARGTDPHAVVCRVNTDAETGDMTMRFEHDPNPSDMFLDRVEYCLFFVPEKVV